MLPMAWGLNWTDIFWKPQPSHETHRSPTGTMAKRERNGAFQVSRPREPLEKHRG